jgi:hypothetical protein
VPTKLHEVEQMKSVKGAIPHYIAIPSESIDVTTVKEISSTGGLTGDRYLKK